MDPYVRHYGLWSAQQQSELVGATVAVGGVGGVGAAETLLLAKAGIGNLRIADRDSYEVENILEQAFATWDTVGQRKVDVAVAEAVRHQIGVRVSPIHADLTTPNVATALVEGCDLVFSGVDNPSARIALGRAAMQHRLPFIVAANVGWSVFHTVYMPENGGYSSAFAGFDNIKKDRDGFPLIDDQDTHLNLERAWCIWTVAISGFNEQELMRFISGSLDHFSYAAAPAYHAASWAVMDGIKLLLGQGTITTFPKVRVVDLENGVFLSSEILRERFDAVSNAWEQGSTAVLQAVRGFDQ